MISFRLLKKTSFILQTLVILFSITTQSAYAINPFQAEFERKLPEIQRSYAELKAKIELMRMTGLKIASLFPIGNTFGFLPAGPISSQMELNHLIKFSMNQYLETSIIPLANQYSWAIPNDEAIQTLKKYGPILEVGAGNGYWAHLLSEEQVTIDAYDNFSWEKDSPLYRGGKKWFNVQSASEDIIEKYSPEWNLFLCYPPMENDYHLASKSLELFKGQVVIYIGGEKDGPTGDDRFFDLLDRDFTREDTVSIPYWPGHEGVQLKTYRRKAK